METLTPRSGYEPHELGITPRALFVVGAFYGLVMAVMEAVADAMEGRRAGSILRSAIFDAVFSGTLFAVILALLILWMAERQNARVYAGNPRVVLPPPEGYRYRMPCMRMTGPMRGVNGVVYLGPQGIRFDPLRRVRARYRGSLVLEPLESITMERVDVRLPRRMRLVGRTHGSRIDIRSGTECVQVMVPATDATFERLQDALHALRQSGDVGEVDPPASISRP
jgi:hypothetical protein